MKNSCAFFGHRECHDNITHTLQDAILDAICNHGIKTFLCGNYGSFDLMAAHAVKQIQTQHPQVELIWVRAYLPRAHEYINPIYDHSIYPNGLEFIPKRFAISKRNEWIIGQCDMVIAYVNSEYGGAYTACRRASRAGKRIVNLGALPRI